MCSTDLGNINRNGHLCVQRVPANEKLNKKMFNYKIPSFEEEDICFGYSDKRKVFI